MRLRVIVIAVAVGLVGCGGGSSTGPSVSTTTSTTSGPTTTEQITVPPTTARGSSTGSGRSGRGIVEGDVPIRRPGPDLGVCATWEDNLQNPPADAPPSFRDTTLQRLHEGDCPGH